MNKVKHIVLWLILIIGSVGLLAFATNERLNQNTLKPEITIHGEAEFINKTDFLTKLNKIGYNFVNTKQQNINLLELENELKSIPYVDSLLVYLTVSGQLKIEAWQREPVLRVLRNNNPDFYVDKKGLIVPVSDKHTAHVPTLSGYVSFIPKLKNILESKIADSINLDEAYQLAVYITDNQFFKSQITAIEVDKNNQFTLYPRIGIHNVLFGTIDKMPQKFDNLYQLYVRGIKPHEWNLFTTINLKYDKQIVCTKR